MVHGYCESGASNVSWSYAFTHFEKYDPVTCQACQYIKHIERWTCSLGSEVDAIRLIKSEFSVYVRS
jgi:hypothetical protein